MSRSNVGYEEPCAPPATPPITTKSIPASTRRSRSGSGSNGSASEGTLKLADAVRPSGLAAQPIGDVPGKVLLEQGHVVAVVDRLRMQCELLAEQVKQLSEGVDRWGDEVALDAGDGGLGRAGSVGELLLGQAVAATGIA